ncbi:MAG: Holliday junction branch migration protein RuvA [Eubacteriales bacterium]
MFYYICGELVHREPTMAVLDCGGVGYQLTVSLLTSDALADRMGGKVRLYTYLNVREDGVDLLGFLTLEELETYKLLRGVSGVGPKVAMSVLSFMPSDRFAYVVCTEDVKGLSKVPGIGAKTAARIVLELKDKLSNEMFTGHAAPEGVPGGKEKAPRKNGKLGEATEALLALGYDRSDVLGALQGIDPERLSVEQVITQALKKFT